MPRIVRLSSSATARQTAIASGIAQQHEDCVRRALVEGFLVQQLLVELLVIFEADVAGGGEDVVAREAEDDAEEDRPGDEDNQADDPGRGEHHRCADFPRLVRILLAPTAVGDVHRRRTARR